MTEINIDAYVRGRGRVKSSISKMEKFVININSKTPIEEIEVRLDKIEELFKEFIIYDDYIGSLEKYTHEFDEIEDRVMSIKAMLLQAKSRIEGESKYLPSTSKIEIDSELNKALNTLSSNQQLLIESAHGNHSSLLPKMHLQNFNGEYRNWPSFKDNYEKLIHDNQKLSEIEKFTLLKHFLDPEPSLLIKNLIVSKENYENAWRKLNKRYDNKGKVANSYLDSFFNLKPVREGSAEEIRIIADTTENILNGLDGIDADAKKRDIWLIYILLGKLDSNTKHLWAEKINEKSTASADNVFPDLSNFLEFLDERRATLETLQDQQPSNQRKTKHNSDFYNKYSNKVSSHFIQNSKTDTKCILCNSTHPIYKCINFKKLNPTERRKFVTQNNLCFNCLSNSHRVQKCSSKNKCFTCHNNHHTSLHINKTTEPKVNSNFNSTYQNSTSSTINGNSQLNVPSIPQSTSSTSVNNNSTVSTYSILGTNSSVLPTAQVIATNLDSASSFQCNVLLDSGSQISFITESAVQQLRLKKQYNQLTVTGLSSTGSIITSGIVHLRLKSIHNDSGIHIKAHVIHTISSSVPEKTTNTSGWSYLKEVQLADNNFYLPKRIDILLGADYFFDILKNGKLSGYPYPSLHNTIFGWVVAGSQHEDISHFKTFKVTIQDNNELQNMLTRFWELEEIPTSNQSSVSHEFCENHFKNTMKLTKEGKFVVSLPIQPNELELGDSIASAISQFYSTERRLIKNPHLYEQYRQFLNEYQQLGHMQLITDDKINAGSNKIYYLPHHCIERPDKTTTKLRVVFNGSNKSTSDVSLNDVLAVGPTVQRDLQSILLNFRWHQIGLIGDIEKMYRQVLITDSDQDLQRIVWRDRPEQPLQHFKLCTVTYGTASAPFLATRCLREIGLQNRNQHSKASEAIINDFYVDDFISGASNIEEAIELQKIVSDLLQKRHFSLRKWMTNSSQLLNYISSNSTNDCIDLNIMEKEFASTKVLGLNWEPQHDLFTYKVNLSKNQNITKRIILSETSKIFDPLGFLSPCIIGLKILMQELWLQKVNWDDQLSVHILNKWNKLYNQFYKFQQVKIPRWIKTPGNEIELIGFCDASELAYSAAIYVKTINQNNEANVQLLVAKSKVAPLKRLTIPRLELCGANLLTTLYSFVCTSLNISSVKMTAFTDSSVVLSWLASQPNRWKPYVANRISKIIEVLPSSQWKHVSTKHNPSDCASRGIPPEQLVNHNLLWHGPAWLVKDSNEWPTLKFKTDGPEVETESRKVYKLQSFYTIQINNTMEHIFAKFSSLTKIIRILCYCQRINGKWKLSTSGSHFLQSSELEESLKICIKWAQASSFKDEIKALQTCGSVSQKSPLKTLKPFLDNQGLLRVLGRLQNASINFDTKHPYILPKNHKLSELIIRLLHLKHLHAGPTLLINIIRSKYWIVSCRQMIKREIKNCVICTRHRATTQQQLMAPLPKARVTPSRPFSKTGLDYAGPFLIKQSHLRNSKTMKAYLAVFVCLSTKAAHLELVSNLSTEAFLAALRRFVSRRGLPAELISDNGSNFIGAKRQLNEFYDMVLKDREEIADFCSNNKILWTMIPPAAPLGIMC